MLEIVVDSHIRIRGLSKEWVHGLAQLCSFENEAKEVALREHLWKADELDDKLTLAEYDGETLVLPRGFIAQLINLLKNNNIDYKIIGPKSWVIPDFVNQAHPTIMHLRQDQMEAYKAIVTSMQGRIIAPPGKGKTIIALAAIGSMKIIWKSKLDRMNKALIIVQQKHIAQQWVDKGKDFYNMDIGFIGDNRWEEKDITVALIQTLWSQHKMLDETTFWDKWYCVILDEQHHIPAETFTQILSKFSSPRRYGLSATIGKSKAKEKVSQLVFGPILYEDKEAHITPTVRVVRTSFDFPYEPTKKVKVGNKQKVKRNNYKDMISDLATDKFRNQIICWHIVGELSACNLVVSDRLAQLDQIEEILYHEDVNTYKLTGKETLDQRMNVYEYANEGSCVILSTVASEALDIPRIDRIHLVYPRKNTEAIWQIIGRGTRPHPDKDGLVVYDYVDYNVKVLNNQFLHRLRKLYKPKGFEVELPQSTT